MFEALTGSEQLALMHRLGYYLVWATLARPEGLHFRRAAAARAHAQPPAWKLHTTRANKLQRAATTPFVPPPRPRLYLQQKAYSSIISDGLSRGRQKRWALSLFSRYRVDCKWKK